MIDTTILYLEGPAAIALVLIWTFTFVWAAYCTAKLFAASRFITKLKKELKSYRYALQFYNYSKEDAKSGKHLSDDGTRTYTHK